MPSSLNIASSNARLLAESPKVRLMRFILPPRRLMLYQQVSIELHSRKAPTVPSKFALFVQYWLFHPGLAESPRQSLRQLAPQTWTEAVVPLARLRARAG